MTLNNLPPQPLMSPEAEAYAAWCLAQTAQVQTRTRHVLDIPYGPDNWQKLDLYLPDTAPASATLPTLLFMHGGYWTHGYKDWLGFMAPAFVPLPALFMSVDYRLAPASPYPAALDDCLSALTWAYHNVTAYGGDPQQLFVGGHSAGGHLAALMALQPALFIDRELPVNVITACFPVSGVYDLEGDIPQDRLQAFLPSHINPAKASPVHHVVGNQTPFLLAVGERDFPVLYEQAHTMAAALRQTSGPVELLEIPGADHFQMSQYGGDPAHLWVQRVQAWMTGDR
jgi:arylformamidase